MLEQGREFVLRQRRSATPAHATAQAQHAHRLGTVVADSTGVAPLAPQDPPLPRRTTRSRLPAASLPSGSRLTPNHARTHARTHRTHARSRHTLAARVAPIAALLTRGPKRCSMESRRCRFPTSWGCTPAPRARGPVRRLAAKRSHQPRSIYSPRPGRTPRSQLGSSGRTRERIGPTPRSGAARRPPGAPASEATSHAARKGTAGGWRGQARAGAADRTRVSQGRGTHTIFSD